MSDKIPTSRNQPLFDHMAQDHGLTLTVSECDEIELVVARMLADDRYRKAGMLAAQAGTAFVCDQMPWEKEWLLRIVIPGIDGGSAVHLETTCVRQTREGAEELLDKIMEGLPNVRRERGL